MREHKPVFMHLLWMAGIIMACRLSSGAAAALLPLAGLYYMSKKRMGPVMVCYMFLPFMANINRSLMGGMGLFGYASRVGIFIMTILLIIQSGHRRGSQKLPLGLLFLYLVVAVVSSIDGWFPMISYLKILNFLFFLSGIYIGTRNLHQCPRELDVIRNALFAFAIFIVFGSIALIPFPALGYSMMMSNFQSWGASADLAAEMLATFDGVMTYSGIANHSQTLAPLVVCLSGWLLCDMLFVERRFEVLHMAVVGTSPILLYMTRSRVGSLGFVVMLALVYCYAMPKSSASRTVRRKLQGMFIGFVAMGLVAGIVMEVKDHSISRLLRKTENLEGDARGLGEAVTASRQGAIEMNMYDFARRPLLGMGFQVWEEHIEEYRRGRISLLSAPIEKGLLPLMVLGETGVLGGFVFGAFLIAFFSTCKRKRYVVTATLFTVFLFLNMAEAVFFSPLGSGGSMWVITVIGGFVVDMRQFGSFGSMPMPMVSYMPRRW